MSQRLEAKPFLGSLADRDKSDKNAAGGEVMRRSAPKVLDVKPNILSQKGVLCPNCSLKSINKVLECIHLRVNPQQWRK